MTKSEMADRATDYMAVGYLASLVALVNDVIKHGPWVQYTSFVVFVWTIARVLWWASRKFYLWRKGRSFVTISKDGDE